MATVPTPRTWTIGEVLSAAKMNAELRDALAFLLAPPMAILRKTANQLLPNGIHQTLTYETEDLDRDGGHSTTTNNTRYVAQTAGWHSLGAAAVFAANGSGWRDVMFQKNATSATRQNRAVVAAIPGGAAQVAVAISGHMYLNVSDFVEVAVYQNSGGGLNVLPSDQDSRFEIRWVST
ncbi:hypothetical protein ACFWYW_14640 [Nonomuraea sp. NPDC059023]|uniref:hypothetical protein n=1 Tax=unclassified Nonomuraea TaxID=2593643 RepID=UPI0036C69FB8